MRASRNGLLFICRREALCTVAYVDGKKPDGSPLYSIGFGHSDPTLKEGQGCTVREAFETFKKDIEPREERVSRALDVPVEQHQFDALLSLHYQSGSRYFPFLARLINAGKPMDAAAMFPACDRNLAGEQMAGLRKRRLLEQRLFLTGDYGELSPIPMWRGDPRKTKPESYHVQDGDL